MTRVYKNIDDLFSAELAQTSAVPPVSVKAGVDAGLGFGGNALDDLFKSDMADGGVSPPDFVKTGIDAGLGFGTNSVDDLFKSEMGDGNVTVPDFVKAGIDANLAIDGQGVDDLYKNKMPDGGVLVPDYVKTNIYTQLGFASNRKYWLGLSALLIGGLLIWAFLPGETIDLRSNVHVSKLSANSVNDDSNISETSAANDPSEQVSVVSDGGGGGTRDQMTTRVGFVASGNHHSGSSSNVILPVLKDNGGSGENNAISSSANSDDEMNSSDQPGLQLTESDEDGVTEDILNTNVQQAGSGIDEMITGDESVSETLSEGDEERTNDDADKIKASDESAVSSVEVKDTNQVDASENVVQGNDSPVKESSSENADEGVKIERPASAYKHWFVSVTGGMNLAKSFYEGSDIDEEQLYTSSMKDRVGNEFQASVNYRFKKGLMLGTGLNYAHFSEQYHFVDQFWLKDSLATYELVIDSMGVDTVWTWDYDSTQITNFDKSGRLYANYISIPVNFGVQIPLKKFRLDLLATVRYNFLTGSGGTYHNDSGFVSYTKSDNVLRKGYLDMMFTAGVHYNFWKNFYLSATVRYRPVFGKMYQETSFNKKFQYTHFGLGLSYNF